ncbi:MAG TPA: hypothetical protein VGN07_21150 [Steroidobacteraceae bacterium]|jgi:hypothetical protein
MTRLAKPEKKAGKGNERREIYANQRIKANGRRPLNLRDTVSCKVVDLGLGSC